MVHTVRVLCCISYTPTAAKHLVMTMAKWIIIGIITYNQNWTLAYLYIYIVFRIYLRCF